MKLPGWWENGLRGFVMDETENCPDSWPAFWGLTNTALWLTAVPPTPLA